jgi:hypothetical protein
VAAVGEFRYGDRFRKTRRRGYLVHALALALTILFAAWIFFHNLVCQGAFFIHHRYLCTGSFALPVAPLLLAMFFFVLIFWDVGNFADERNLAPRRRPRFIHGFGALDRRHKIHVGAAATMHLLEWAGFVGVLWYLMEYKDLMFR